MVQAPRLDLIRLATALLALSIPLGAQAQPLAPSSPLLQDGPLTTLLQPQKLDRSRPLLRPEESGSAESASGRGAPCTRQSRAAGPAPSVLGGGSGPGDYGRFLPSAPSTASPSTAATSTAATPNAATRPGSASAPAGAAPPARAPGVDRPLYGGTDRPLWDTGDRRPVTAGKPAPSSDTERTATATATAAPAGTAPAPPRDRPLWGDGSLMASADPAAGAGIVPAPCIDPAPATPR